MTTKDPEEFPPGLFVRLAAARTVKAIGPRRHAWTSSIKIS